MILTCEICKEFGRLDYQVPRGNELPALVPQTGSCGNCQPRTLSKFSHERFVPCFLGFHPDVPSYPFDEKFDNFAFNCLLTREEAIIAMGKVRSECNKVAGMYVFQVPVSKSMKLEEFEQTQAQVSTQVPGFQ